MRNKLPALGLSLALMLGALSGCTLADPSDGSQADTLVGLYLTTEYLDLFDFERYISDQLSSGFSGGEIDMGGDTAAYEERMYATVEEENGRSEYCFPVEGLRLFATLDGEGQQGQLYTDAGTQDLKLSVTDEGQAIEATVYLDGVQGSSLYFNPVYQTADGQIYLTAGTGTSVSMDSDSLAGSSFSHSLSSESTTTDTDGTVTAQSSSFTVTVEFWAPPEQVAVTQMSGEGEVLRRDVFDGDSLPDTLPLAPGMAYCIQEEYHTQAGEQTADRTLLNRDDCADGLSFLLRGDGPVCMPHWLAWD